MQRESTQLTDRQRIIAQVLHRAVVKPTPNQIASRSGSRSLGGVVRSLRRGQELGLWSSNHHDQWYLSRRGTDLLNIWEDERDDER